MSTFTIHFAGQVTHRTAGLVDVAREALRMAGSADVYVVSGATGHQWEKLALKMIVEGKR